MRACGGERAVSTHGSAVSVCDTLTELKVYHDCTTSLTTRSLYRFGLVHSTYRDDDKVTEGFQSSLSRALSNDRSPCKEGATSVAGQTSVAM
jgi:hypothetical protein